MQVMKVSLVIQIIAGGGRKVKMINISLPDMCSSYVYHEESTKDQVKEIFHA